MTPYVDKDEFHLLRNIVSEGWVVPSDLDIDDLKRVLTLIAKKYVTLEWENHHRYPLVVPTKAGQAYARR